MKGFKVQKDLINIMNKIVQHIKWQGEDLDVIGYKNLDPVRLSNLLNADYVVLIVKSKKMQN